MKTNEGSVSISGLEHPTSQSTNDDKYRQAIEIMQIALEYAAKVPGTVRSNEKSFSSWLDNNSTQWLKRVAQHRLTKATRSQVTILSGEEGSGKTTALLNAAQVFELRGYDVIRIDFTASGSAPSTSSDEDISAWIFGTIKATIRGRLDTNEREHLNAERVRRLLTSRPHFKFEELVRKKGEGYFSRFDDFTLMKDSDVQLALAVYEQRLLNMNDPLYFELAQVIRTNRCVIICDNADHYGARVVDRLFAELTTRLTDETIFLAAVRPEFEYLAMDRRQARHSEVIDLQERHDKALMIEIAEKRLRTAVRYVNSQRPELKAAAALCFDRYMWGLQQIKSIDSLHEMMCRWTNYNYRQAVEYITPLYRAPRDKSRFPGYMWSQFMKRVPVTMLEIFRPKPIHTNRWSNMPFMFLRIRILSMLNLETRNRREPWTVRGLCDRLWDSFGIPERFIRSALADLSEKNTSCGSLLRTGAEESEDQTVTLLPAGRLMIDTVIFKVDFLSQAYLAGEVVDSSRRPPRRPSSPEKKAQRAAIQVEQILDSFKREHPYMAVARQIRPAEVPRLRCYGDFGYRKGRWFIGSLRYSLQEYCGQHPAMNTIFMDTINKIKGYEFQLDKALEVRV